MSNVVFCLCSEITVTLEKLGISAHQDTAMVVQIKEEVRRLCTGEEVSAQVLRNELKNVQRMNINNMIYKDTTSAEVVKMSICLYFN